MLQGFFFHEKSRYKMMGKGHLVMFVEIMGYKNTLGPVQYISLNKTKNNWSYPEATVHLTVHPSLLVLSSSRGLRNLQLRYDHPSRWGRLSRQRYPRSGEGHDDTLRRGSEGIGNAHWTCYGLGACT